MFDALVLRKPVILFAKDKNAYLNYRGTYYSYPNDYSQYFFEWESELAEFIGHAEWNDYFEERRQFYCGACDGHSVERTIELIRSVL